MDSVTLSSKNESFFSKIWSEFSENIFDFFLSKIVIFWLSPAFSKFRNSKNFDITRIFFRMEAVLLSWWYKRSPTLTSWVYTDPISVRTVQLLGPADFTLVKISGRAVVFVLSLHEVGDKRESGKSTLKASSSRIKLN